VSTFTAKLRIWNPEDPQKVEELEPSVDTGAAFSWITRTRLQRLGVKPSRQMKFRTIDGRMLERDLAVVYVGVNEYTAPDLVVMAGAGEMEVIGAHSLEGLGVAADPVQRRLVPTVMLALQSRRYPVEIDKVGAIAPA